MKRLLLIVIGVLLCTPLYSDMNTYIAGVPVSGGGATVIDDFSSDTSANYTTIGSYDISVSAGKAHGNAWHNSYAYNETSLSTANHYVQGKIMAGTNTNEYSALIARCNGTSYVKCYIKGGVIWVTDSGGNFSANYDGSYTASTEYTVKMVLSGTNTKVYVDGSGTPVIDDTDANNNLAGTYVGVGFVREYANEDVTVDDLEADDN